MVEDTLTKKSSRKKSGKEKKKKKTEEKHDNSDHSKRSSDAKKKKKKKKEKKDKKRKLKDNSNNNHDLNEKPHDTDKRSFEEIDEKKEEENDMDSTMAMKRSIGSSEKSKKKKKKTKKQKTETNVEMKEEEVNLDKEKKSKKKKKKKSKKRERDDDKLTENTTSEETSKSSELHDNHQQKKKKRKKKDIVVVDDIEMKQDIKPSPQTDVMSPNKLDEYKRSYADRTNLRDEVVKKSTIEIKGYAFDFNQLVDNLKAIKVINISKKKNNQSRSSNTSEKSMKKVKMLLDEAVSTDQKQFASGNATRAIVTKLLASHRIDIADLVWKWVIDNESLIFGTNLKPTGHYNTFLAICDRKKDWEAALDIFHTMEVRDEITYAFVISACGKGGNFQKAMELLEQMKEEPKLVYKTGAGFNAAITACEKALDSERAFEIFESMKNVQGVQASARTYSALISAYEKCGQWREALDTLYKMEGLGFGVNVIAYTAVISALSKGRQWQKALELFHKIEKSSQSPSIVTYNATMTALERGLQWERALDLFDEMKFKKLPITVVSFGCAIAACEKGYQWQQCLDYLDEMDERGIAKNTVIYGAAMSCMDKCRRADLAFKLMDRLEKDGLHPNAYIYNSAISACSRCEMKNEARKLFLKMGRNQPDIVTYNALIDAYIDDLSTSRKYFKEAFEKGLYAYIFKKREEYLHLDLHFLSLGSGQAAIHWWIEECLYPILSNEKTGSAVKVISILTGKGKSRRRKDIGDDGMHSRTQSYLQLMNIKTVSQPNSGRIQLDKDSLIRMMNKNEGKVIIDESDFQDFIKKNKETNLAEEITQTQRPREGSPRKPEFEKCFPRAAASEKDVQMVGGRIVSNSSDDQKKDGVSLLLFYQYIEPVLSESLFKKLLSHVETVGEKFSITGRMRVAKEGLNCTLTGSYSNIRCWCKALREFEGGFYFSETEFKLTDGLPEEQAFPKLHAFKVDEIVNYGLAGQRAPSITMSGEHLEPHDYHKKMNETDTVIIDVRNHYEANIGKFQPPEQGAKYIDPMMRKSTEFPVWLDKPETKEMLRNKQVLMYCTGGVRCERASALLRTKIETEEDTKNLGIKGVYQLQGGIDKYFREFPEGGLWKGKNYVFDKRFAHAPDVIENKQKSEDDSKISGPMGKCEACHKPWDRYGGKRRCPTCGVPSLICKDCHDADARGERKLGNDIRCDLCVKEDIRSKRQIKEKEEKEMEAYESKLRKVYNFQVGSKKNGQDRSVQRPSSNIKETVSGTAVLNTDKVTRVFIKNLSRDKVDQKKLCELFKGITHIQWLKDKETYEWYGAVIVEMATPEDASNAVEMNGKIIFGRKVQVAFSQPNSRVNWPPPNTKI